MCVGPLSKFFALSAAWRCRLFVVIMAAAGLGACSAGSEGSLSAALVSGSLPAADTLVANEPPTVVYSNIAQKALTCWMGPKGPLKATHIFHADAASPTTGGKADGRAAAGTMEVARARCLRPCRRLVLGPPPYVWSAPPSFRTAQR